MHNTEEQHQSPFQQSGSRLSGVRALALWASARRTTNPQGPGGFLGFEKFKPLQAEFLKPHTLIDAWQKRRDDDLRRRWPCKSSTQLKQSSGHGVNVIESWQCGPETRCRIHTILRIRSHLEQKQHAPWHALLAHSGESPRSVAGLSAVMSSFLAWIFLNPPDHRLTYELSPRKWDPPPYRRSRRTC